MDDQNQTTSDDAAEQPAPADDNRQADDSTAAVSNANPELEAIRKDALDSLTPLIDSMDASPERKFELLMTVIRVNFDQELLRKALEAAKGIEDATAKAEALIDIVNETNYQDQNP